MGVPIVSGGDRICGAPPHWGVHQEEADDHSREGGLPPCLCTVHVWGADDGDDPVGTMVVSRRDK